MSYLERMKIKANILKNKEVVNILAIESSCDETSIAVVQNGRKVLSNVISSQIDIHKRFGGVVPEVASRNHISAINNVYEQALQQANMKSSDIDAIAVTYGAGLIGALFVGVNFAKALAYALDIPLIAVNHIKGHISANYIAEPKLEPPFACLVISGGHTSIFDIKSYNELALVGQTLDDAVGEAFDKVARVMGISYPGGPNVERQAKLGKDNINFIKHSGNNQNFNFSFSGIKTAVINYINKIQQKGEEIPVSDICASFQSLVARELADKSIRATEKLGYKTLVLAGGVSANRYIFEYINKLADEKNIKVFAPPLILCTDNAAMIGSAGYYILMSGEDVSDINLTAKSNIQYI